MTNGTIVKGASPKTVERATAKATVRQACISLMETVPFADDDNGFGMVAAILAASDWEDFATAASKLPNAADVVGLRLRVREIVRHESDIDTDDDSGLDLPWYLVIDSTDIDTGKAVMWQTSAATLVAKLVKLHDMHKFPAIVSTSVAAKATKRGFYPMNLTVHAVNGE